MTVGEMKKRVRSVLEYVGRIQIEEVKRGERAKMLGLDKVPAEHDDEEHHEDEAAGKEGEEAKPTSAEAIEPETAPLTRSMQLMDELTRDLIKFQEICEGGTVHGQAGGGDHDGTDGDN